MFEGRVVAIYVAPGEGAPMEARDEVRALAGKGLEGDRYAIDAGKYSGTKVGKRAITLIEREAVEAARTEYGVELEESETRRNLVTEGMPVNHLVGKEFTVGGVPMRGYDLAEPCTYLEGLTREGIRRSLVHRGGLRAEILDDGPIRVGDVVRLVGPDPA
ncbi:MAG: MOSC domain-containing protein [Acidimicrobiia bacterium]